MIVGIIGSNDRAAAIGRLLARRHTLSFSDPSEPERAKRLAEAIGSPATVAAPYEQVMRSDVVILALAWKDVDRALAAAGPFDGKIVVDATNADRATAVTSSELIARKINEDHVVKAFNMLPPDTLLRDAKQGIALYYCGDERHDKAVAADLIRDAGYAPIDLGKLRNGREIEPGGPRFGAEIPADQAA